MEKRKIKILSIDGGGLRGIIPLIILDKIEKMTGKKIHELFDVIIGTSTGGIIATGLTATKDGINPCLSINDMINLYTTNGEKIFPSSNNIFTKSYRSVKTLFRPIFSNKELYNHLDKYFGDLTLKDTLKPIILTSYDIKHNEVLMFKSRKANLPTYNAKLKDICMATSASPKYLPSYKINFGGSDRVCIDGGTYINNPSMAGIVDVLNNKYSFDVKVEDIELLSLGTGLFSEFLGYENTEKWGIIKWASNIATLMLQATSKSVDYECKQLPLHKYLRLQVIIHDKDKSDMSDSRKSTYKYMIENARKQILNIPDRIRDIKGFFEK